MKYVWVFQGRNIDILTMTVGQRQAVVARAPQAVWFDANPTTGANVDELWCARVHHDDPRFFRTKGEALIYATARMQDLYWLGLPILWRAIVRQMRTMGQTTAVALLVLLATSLVELVRHQLLIARVAAAWALFLLVVHFVATYALRWLQRRDERRKGNAP